MIRRMDVLKQNQQGLTLIEMLITLSILSFIGILIWGIFFRGIDYSNKAISRNLMQQEANIIISTLTSIHQTSDSYKLDFSNCKISVTYKKDLSEQAEIYENQNFCFSNNSSFSNSPPLEIFPNNSDMPLTLYIKNIKNLSEFSIETVLYRLKGDESE